MNNSEFTYSDDISIVLAGAAGQGIQTVENILVKVMKQSGFHVYATKEYMSRVRGGVNSIEIRIASKPVSAFVERIDLFVPLNVESYERKFLHRRLSSKTTIIGESQVLSECIKDEHFIDVPFTEIATKVGNKIYSNVVAAGALSGLFNVNFSLLKDYIHNLFKNKSKSIIEDNIKAAREGYSLGQSILSEHKIAIHVKAEPEIKEHIIINGTEAVSYGAIAGGCNFISSYPMSPSTGVFLTISNLSQQFGIAMDQAEDEIAAINMNIGAWYAGARAITSTSGGGFALMNEGLSLSGITETPFVLHLASRPGPGTGLPTRTAQADLSFVMSGGHGDIARIILAPGTLQQAFEAAQLAFNFADKYQVPIFILTDQYFVDSYYTINPKHLDINQISIEKSFIETDKDYRRYKITPDGISPRGIPGHGKGFVAVDSDEHDENGRITEDHDIRIQMVKKRYFKRLKLLKQNTLEPTLLGDENYSTLIIGWGSTFPIIKEAFENINLDATAFLHFMQVYPLADKIKNIIEQAENVIVIENNATGQFADILKNELDIEVDHRILKFDGLPFSVEEIAEKLENLISLQRRQKNE